MRDTKERVVQVELPKKVGSSSRSSNVYSPKMCLDGLEEGLAVTTQSRPYMDTSFIRTLEKFKSVVVWSKTLLGKKFHRKIGFSVV